MTAILAVLCATHAATLGDLPEPLRRMQEARARLFSTAQIEWSLDEGNGPRFYSSRYANGDFALVELGDETGLVEPRLLRPRMAGAYFPYHRLRTAEGDQWGHRDGEILAGYHEPGCKRTKPMPDIRTFGFLPYKGVYDTPEELQPGSFLEANLDMKGLVFQVRDMPSGYVEVTATSEVEQLLWELDPSKDFLPVHTREIQTFRNGDVRTYSSDTFYQEWDGRWFPETIQFTDGPRNLTEVVTVMYASFDDPEQPQRLEVDKVMGMGMVPGVNVGYHFADGHLPGAPYIFDGKRAVSQDERNRRVREGTFPSYDAFNKLFEWYTEEIRGREPRFGWLLVDIPTEVRRGPGLWEPYTQRFIIFYQLGRDQTKRAWEILKNCQTRAYEYLDEKTDEFTDVQKRLTLARAKVKNLESEQEEPAEAGPLQEANRELDRLEDYRKRLYDPIDDMFERCLKRQLAALLTDRQIADAKARAIKMRRDSPKPDAGNAPATP